MNMPADASNAKVFAYTYAGLNLPIIFLGSFAYPCAQQMQVLES